MSGSGTPTRGSREAFTLGKLFDSVADRWADRTAIVTGADERYSYAELDEAVNATARSLSAAGLTQGDRVAFVLRNIPEYVIGHFAAQKLGCVSVLVNFRAAPNELAHIVGTADAGALFYEEMFADGVETAQDQADPAVSVSVGDGGFTEFQSADTSAVECQGVASDPAYICHTSGSTGRPKLVPHTHEDMRFNANQWIQEMAIGRDERAFVLVPIFHVVGLNYLHPHVFAGATSVLQAEFDPADALALIDAADVTGFFAVPAQINAMVQAHRGRHDLSSLSYFRTGGDSITADLVDRGRDVFAEDFYNLYGLTEITTNPVVYTPEDPPEKATTVGPLWYYGWDIRVVQPAEVGDVDPEAIIDCPGSGLLLVKGVPVMEGYLDNPEATDEVFVDGWFNTEDIVHIDEDGFVTIVDRVDNMIVSGGENIYPQEVETVLMDHPGVSDCGVLGIEDEEWGQRVVALVVPLEDVATEDLDIYLKNSPNLADYKRPRDYVFVDEIPRNVSGSIVREELSNLVA